MNSRLGSGQLRLGFEEKEEAEAGSVGTAVPARSPDKGLRETRRSQREDTHAPCRSAASKRSQARVGFRSKNQKGKTTIYSWARDLHDTGLDLLVFGCF